MSAKRAREPVSSTEYPLMKRQRTETPLPPNIPPPTGILETIFGGLRKAFSSQNSMVSQANGSGKSRSQMRNQTFKSLSAARTGEASLLPSLPNGAGRISDTPEPGGILAAIREADHQSLASSSSRGRKALFGGSIDLVTPGAGPSRQHQLPTPPDSQSGPVYQSPAKRLLRTARSFISTPFSPQISVPETRLFDEGTLRPELGSSAQPIELDDSTDSEPEAGPSSPTSPSSSPVAPASPLPSTSAPSLVNGRRPPSRPKLSEYEAPKRSYDWLDSGSGYSDSSATPDSTKLLQERRRHTTLSRKRSSVSRNNYRRVTESNGLWNRRLQLAVRAMMGAGSEEEQKAGEHVAALFEETREQAERRFGSRTEHGKHSKQAINDLLLPVGLRPSLSSVLHKPNPTFVPARYRRQADRAKALASLRPEFVIDDVVERIKQQTLEDEAKIQARLRPSVPTKMAASRAKLVSQYLSDRTFNAKFLAQNVGLDSLRRLRGTEWLDDEIVNFYGAMLQARSDAAQKSGGSGKTLPDIFYLNSFFYQKLKDNGYEGARLGRWTKRAKVDIFNKDLVIFPINLKNLHWVVGAINVKLKRLEFYDSMGDSTGDRRVVFELLWTYLEKEHRDKKGTEFDSEGWTESFANDTPRQDNLSDCGVFTCQTLEALSRGLDLTQSKAKGFEFSAKNMPYIRQLMIYEIGQEALENRWPKEDQAVNGA